MGKCWWYTPGGKQGYAVEVFNAVGETITVTTVDADAVEPLRADEVRRAPD
ncbi:MAG TPA: hypothetical protein VK530_01950 [Candidatus Acidoferrum sp.]|nr:hypothetical protein [Candidatus Acidoferrum sp.]